jgi:hypothetical protein
MIARLEKSFYGAEELAQMVSDPADTEPFTDSPNVDDPTPAPGGRDYAPRSRSRSPSGPPPRGPPPRGPAPRGPAPRGQRTQQATGATCIKADSGSLARLQSSSVVQVLIMYIYKSLPGPAWQEQPSSSS